MRGAFSNTEEAHKKTTRICKTMFVAITIKSAKTWKVVADNKAADVMCAM